MVNVRTQGLHSCLRINTYNGEGLVDRSTIYTIIYNAKKRHRGHRNPREPGAGKKIT